MWLGQSKGRQARLPPNCPLISDTNDQHSEQHNEHDEQHNEHDELHNEQTSFLTFKLLVS